MQAGCVRWCPRCGGQLMTGNGLTCASTLVSKVAAGPTVNAAPVHAQAHRIARFGLQVLTS